MKFTALQKQVWLLLILYFIPVILIVNCDMGGPNNPTLAAVVATFLIVFGLILTGILLGISPAFHKFRLYIANMVKWFASND